MHVDANALPPHAVVKSDLCIIGAGAAGLTIAKELSRSSVDVVVLESGGFEFDSAIQELYEGENVGLRYNLTATRIRYFGGTTNHWGGVGYPLDAHDFEERAWLPHSGWPFGLDDLMPYYIRAQAMCQLGSLDYPPKQSSEGSAIGFMGGHLRPLGAKSNPLRFGDVYRDELLRGRNVRIFTHASVLELETNAAASRVSRARVKAFRGEEFFVFARTFILAAGGIENPRVLLLSNSTVPQGLGNQHDLVGRYFQEHVGYYLSGIVVLKNNPDDKSCPAPGDLWFTFTDETITQNKLLNAACALSRTKLPDVSLAQRTYGQLSRRLLGRDPLPMNLRYWAEEGVQPFDLAYETEQAPNPDSRVTLGNQLDRFGQRRVRLDWRVTDLDRAHMKRGLEMIGREFGRLGEGRLWIRPRILVEWPPQHVSGGSHHLGTTRMHVDPRNGVVDENCRVHGVGNLYVAGSSVFPTGGKANPTLTIVALAVRLGDHLRGLKT